MPIDFNRGELSWDEFMAKMIEKLKVENMFYAKHALFILKIKVTFYKRKKRVPKTYGNHNHWSLTVDNANTYIPDT